MLGIQDIKGRYIDLGVTCTEIMFEPLEADDTSRGWNIETEEGPRQSPGEHSC